MPELNTTYRNDELLLFFRGYINDESCKTPSEFFFQHGISKDELKSARENVFKNDPDLYRKFVSKWRESILERKNKSERKQKHRISKVIYLIENVEDFDILEFWKLIPYDGDEDFLYNMINYVKSNFGEKYYDFVDFLARNKLLEDEGLLRIDSEEIKSNPTTVGGTTVSAASNQFIIAYMEKYNIPMIRRAYYDVLDSYLYDRDKIIRDVYDMKPAKVKKKQKSN